MMGYDTYIGGDATFRTPLTDEQWKRAKQIKPEFGQDSTAEVLDLDYPTFPDGVSPNGTTKYPDSRYYAHVIMDREGIEAPDDEQHQYDFEALLARLLDYLGAEADGSFYCRGESDEQWKVIVEGRDVRNVSGYTVYGDGDGLLDLPTEALSTIAAMDFAKLVETRKAREAEWAAGEAERREKWAASEAERKAQRIEREAVGL